MKIAKNIVTTSLIVVFVAVCVIAGGALITKKQKVPALQNVASSATPSSIALSASPVASDINVPSQSSSFYNLSQVATHNDRTSCWMTIQGKVYDVTKYINSHPGGMSILDGCGKDATSLFANVHSARAWGKLSPFEIGTLN